MRRDQEWDTRKIIGQVESHSTQQKPNAKSEKFFYLPLEQTL